MSVLIPFDNLECYERTFQRSPTSQEQTRGRLPVPRTDDSVSLVLFWSEKSATKEIRELDRQR